MATITVSYSGVDNEPVHFVTNTEKWEDNDIGAKWTDDREILHLVPFSRVIEILVYPEDY